MTIIGEAFIEVKPDTKGFGPTTEKSVLGSVTSIAKKAGAIIGGLFIADKARTFFTGAVSGATDLAESISKNNIVFGSASEAVLKFSETAATGIGQSQAQALEATGTFGNLFRALNIGETPAAKMSTTLVKLAGDLASFNNVSPEEALDALRSGLVGETEPLKRFGVNLNEATIKAKALELGIGDGTTALTASEKAQAAYALILDQTALAQGDFERTSGGLANQQRILTAQWEDMKAKVGNLLLPVLTDLAVFANTTLLPGLENLARSVGDVLGPAFEGLADIWRELGQGDLAGSLAVEIGKLVGLAEDSPLVDALATAFETLGTAISDTMSNIAGWVAPAVTAVRDELGGAIATAQGAWDEFATEGVGPVADAMDRINTVADDVNTLLAEQRDILIPAAAAASAFAAAFVTYAQVSRAVAGVSGALALLGPALGGAFAPLLANPVGLVVAAVAAVAGAFAAAYFNIEPFRDAVDAVARVIRDVAVGAFEALAGLAERLGPALSGAASAVVSAVGGIVSAASGVATAVIEALTPIVKWIDENLAETFLAAADFVDAFFDRVLDTARPITEVFVATMELIAGVINDVLVASFQTAEPIITGVLEAIGIVLETVANVAVPVFLTAFDGIATAIEVVFNTVLSIIEGALSVIRGIFTVAAGVLRGDWSKIWEGLQDIVLGPINAVRDIISGNLDAIFGFFRDLGPRVFEVFGALWDGVTGLAQNAMDSFTGIVRGAVDGVVGFFSSLPGRIGEFLGSIGETAKGIGLTIVNKMIEGLGGLAGQAGELAGAMFAAVRSLGSNIINGVIDALNDLLPNNIPTVRAEILGRKVTIIPSIDLPNDPIPRINLAAGGLIRARPGGIFANIGEGATNEAVIPLPPGLLEGLQSLAAGERASIDVTSAPVVQNIYTTNPIEAASEAARRHRAVRLALTLR